jgi:hypothetical protein
MHFYTFDFLYFAKSRSTVWRAETAGVGLKGRESRCNVDGVQGVPDHAAFAPVFPAPGAAAAATHGVRPRHPCGRSQQAWQFARQKSRHSVTACAP